MQLASSKATGTGLVLAVLASCQFLMTLDSSVMNVSMPTVASIANHGILAEGEQDA
jgi:hypothetical protein